MNRICSAPRNARAQCFAPALSLLSALLLLCGASCKAPGPKASIRIDTESILTYPFGDPEPVPALAGVRTRGGGARLYPYHTLEGYSATGQARDWTVVRLENPYIEVAVLPDVGGKVWGAREKSTGQEFIYTNHVMKFRDISLRGPWTSGGIEFNFGLVGHTPATATPVDYKIIEHPGGSVSCAVGALDLPSRTRWCVVITVPPDKAYFETRAFWCNPSTFQQSYYAWMNGAVRIGDDLEYALPGNLHIAHDFDVPLRPWPVDETGRDLSWYRNNDFGGYKSYFTVGEYEDFYGGYWHDSDFGFGHWARYDDMPGQKVWIWGLSRQGMIWEELLTDSDGQYTEPQAGRYFNQNDHGPLAPGSADSWREVWFPYRDIGPLVAADPSGVLSVTRDGTALEIGICALSSLDELLVVRAGGTVIAHVPLTLGPLEVHRQTVHLEDGAEPLTVEVGPGLSWSSDPTANDLKRPLDFHDATPTTNEGRFRTAEERERRREFAAALELYGEVVQRDPEHVRALTRLAELYQRRAEYETALDYARRALSLSMYDPGANFAYGILCREGGDDVDALEALGWATRSMEYRSAAYAAMAEIHLSRARIGEALEYARRALDFNRLNVNAHQVLAVALRLSLSVEDARAAVDNLLEIDPLNPLASYERVLNGGFPKPLASFQAVLQGEFPQESYLELALTYRRLGRGAEALQVLGYAPEHPMVLYWRAYLLRTSAAEEAAELRMRAAGLSPLLVFPFRSESLPVLSWAAAEDDGDWKARYYRALVLWHLGRVEETRELMEQCEPGDFAPFYLTRAELRRETRPELVLQDIRRAVEIDRHSWRAWHHLVGELNGRGEIDEGLARAREAVALFPDQVSLRMDLVGSLMGHDLLEEALTLLETTDTLPAEGARAIHSLFVECQVKLALGRMAAGEFAAAVDFLLGSMRYPEQLGSGSPYHPDQRLAQYLMGVCYDELGRSDAARQSYREAADYTLEHGTESRLHQYFGGLALQRVGEVVEGRRLAEEAPPPDPEVTEVLRRLGR